MFRRITMSVSALALILGLALGSTVRGQEAPPASPLDVKKAEAKSGMTDEQILAVVKVLDPKAVMAPIKNATQIRFAYTHKKLTIPLVINLNEGYAWLACNLGQVPNADALPAELLGKMLRSHFPIGPTFFRIGKVGEVDVVEMGHRIDRPVSAERLGMAIREMAGDIETTEPIWTQLVKKEPAK